ncbi:uncharacterized protein [Nicotiana sylvestris]|uniref:Uncharacterized protein LOC104231504 n=1 Tax=Nicotiana sylvestris TaxID=4096 RepID=A0A1U7WW38_NICSY|nr:PREDICTED: uncharacterized protein LOC104231504 [Nicotiana sylvestris]
MRETRDDDKSSKAKIGGYSFNISTSELVAVLRCMGDKVLEEYSITFDDADADGVLTPHNDTLVISLLVHDTYVKRVLIDPGSFVNIILLRVVIEMQANDKMIPKAHTLSGFDSSSVVTIGEIILMTFAEEVVKDTKFHMVEMDIAYNMILDRPWIHETDNVPSTLHQVIMFPSQ